MSWRRLEDVSWRRLEDMSWRCLEDMSWRPLKDFMETNKILTGDICILISGFNKPKCVSSKSVFHKSISDNSKANPKCINHWWLVWCYEISLIQIRHCRKGETIKANFYRTYYTNIFKWIVVYSHIFTFKKYWH